MAEGISRQVRGLQLLVNRTLIVNGSERVAIELPHGYKIHATLLNPKAITNVQVEKVILNSPPPAELLGSYVLLCLNGIELSVLLAGAFGEAKPSPVLAAFWIPTHVGAEGKTVLEVTSPARSIFRPTLPINRLEVFLKTFPVEQQATAVGPLDLIIHLYIF